MAEINKLLQKNDVAAIVILHTPGYSEYKLHVATSYSLASFDGNELRIRSRLKEDFEGDKELQKRMTTDTVNMVHHLNTDSANMFMLLMQMETELKKKFEIDLKGDGHSSIPEQQN